MGAERAIWKTIQPPRRILHLRAVRQQRCRRDAPLAHEREDCVIHVAVDAQVIRVDDDFHSGNSTITVTAPLAAGAAANASSCSTRPPFAFARRKPGSSKTA